MNSTAPLVHATAEMLYANTDMSKLNWFETQWVAWYLWINNPILATGLASFLLHEVRSPTDAACMVSNLFPQIVYFGRCVPWIIIDAMPYFRRWKLQPTKIPTAMEQWECTKQVLFSHFMVELPVVRVASPVICVHP